MSTSGITIDGGYEAEFCSPIPPDYICAICHLAFRSPVQLPCGHQFCKSCWEKCILNSLATCPMDRQNIELRKVFPDIAVERRVLSLLVKCSNEIDGCTWSGELRSLQGHLRVCLLQMTKCGYIGCDTEVKRRDLWNHAINCGYKIVRCCHCEMSFQRQLQETHLSACTEAPVECTHKCGVKDIPRSKLKGHLKKNCSMTILPCRYANVGCKFKGKKNLRETHEDDSVKEHLFLSTNKICELENSNNVGGILWIVEDFKAKVDDTRNKALFNAVRETVSMNDLYYSPPFFTKSGYKLRLYLNYNTLACYMYDDSIGLGMQVIKGRSDPILTWPLQFSYEVKLLSEGAKKKPLVINPKLRPESGYSRPINDNNSPVFNIHIPIETIEEGFLIEDDSIYIRCNILTDEQDEHPAAQLGKKRKGGES